MEYDALVENALHSTKLLEGERIICALLAVAAAIRERPIIIEEREIPVPKDSNPKDFLTVIRGGKRDGTRKL